MLPKLEMSLKQKVGRHTSNQREVCEVAGSGCLIKEKWITLAGKKKKNTQQVQHFKRQVHQMWAAAQTQDRRMCGETLLGCTHVQVLKAVPAKCVLAVFAHHLSAAFVALNIYPAHGALLNGGLCLRPKEGPRKEKLQGKDQECWVIYLFFFNLRATRCTPPTRAMGKVGWI